MHMVMKPLIDDKVEKLLIIDDSSEWYKSIFDYLKYGTFPKSYTKGNHDHLKKLVANYTILVDVLYRKCIDRIFI
jgi:Zn/Cd-binding protein ZinT